MRGLNTDKCSINQNAMLSDKTATGYFSISLFIKNLLNSKYILEYISF